MRTCYKKLLSIRLFGLFISALWVLIVTVPMAFAYTPKAGSPLANRVHPRLLITPNSIPALRNAIATHYKSEFQDYVNWAAAPKVSDDSQIGEAGHDPLRSTIVHQAFIYALGQVPGISYPISTDAYARLAIDKLISNLNNGDSLAYVAALAYDWTYNAMTTTERAQIANLMLNRPISHKVVVHSLASPNFTPTELFSSRYYESFYAWYLGLALWGDGLVDTAADLAVDSFFNVMLNNGYLDAANFVSGHSGGFAEWVGYSSWHPRTHYVLVSGWHTATGENYVAGKGVGKINGNAMKSQAEFLHYAVDPHPYFGNEYTYVRMGGSETTDTSMNHRSMREQLYFLPRNFAEAGLSKEAGLVRYFIEKYKVAWPTYEHFYLWSFLGVPKAYPAVDPGTLNLPLWRWSKNMGTFFARTGFNSQADAVFHVNDGHFRFEGHSGPEDDPGFGLTKFGTLVNTREVAHRGYGNLDDYPGARQRNIVYFEGDHTKTFVSMNSPTHVAQAELGTSDKDNGGIEQITVKDGDFYHVRVDRTRTFNDNVKHTREYVWVPGKNSAVDSDFLVVYDRTQAPSTPHWIYHVPWLPNATNHSSTQDLTTGSGLTDRIGTAYIGSNIIVKELNSLGDEKDNDHGTADFTGGAGAHGVAFSKTLLPKTARVEVTRIAQFDNDVLNRQHHLAIKSNRWQVDVIPTQTNADQRFLHVFETADANLKTAMAATSLLEGGSQLQGAWIQRASSNHPNFVILFNKEAGPQTGTLTYTITGTGTVHHIVTGLQASTSYQIKELNGSTQDKTTEPGVSLWDYKGVATNTPTGTLFFQSTISGTQTYTLVPNGAVQDTTPPQTPSNLIISQLFDQGWLNAMN